MINISLWIATVCASPRTGTKKSVATSKCPIALQLGKAENNGGLLQHGERQIGSGEYNGEEEKMINEQKKMTVCKQCFTCVAYSNRYTSNMTARSLCIHPAINPRSVPPLGDRQICISHKSTTAYNFSDWESAEWNMQRHLGYAPAPARRAQLQSYFIFLNFWSQVFIDLIQDLPGNSFDVSQIRLHDVSVSEFDMAPEETASVQT